MGSNAGSGYPGWFACWSCRRNKTRVPLSRNSQVRTGKTKPVKGNVGYRCLDTSHEYICTCGHRGWSKHSGVTALPLESP